MNTSPVLGLLGGIGSGKTTVAAILERNGAFVLDADRFAGELLFDPEVCREIRKTFGEAVFDESGQVDRAKLADRIFTCETDRQKIHAIIHPRVRSHFKEQVALIQDGPADKVIVLDIPLLLGSELRSLCDLIILVKSSLKTRLKRVARSRGWNQEEIQRREACQPSLEEKEAAADIIIENEGTLEQFEKEVETTLKHILHRP
ncbi:MAG: dephospho-CoA kinase [Planctomycetota bacterium]|jgi:dephospho-CoA kinase